MPKPSRKDWERISQDFLLHSGFPNCFGALDGKHIYIKCPPNSGSQYFCYKHRFTLVLLALTDINRKFLYIDVGAYGKQSDGGVFKISSLYREIVNQTLDLPPAKPFPGLSENMPYVMVADDAFPLSHYLMKPYPKKEPSNLTGHTNLLSYYGLEEYYRKMTRKKLIDKLDEYEDLLGENLNIPGYVDNSSLKFLIDHPPICGKEIRTLSSSAFAGFRLNPGTLPLQYQTLAKKAANINKSTHQNYSAYSSQTYSALDHQPFVKLMSGEKDPLGTHTDQSHEPELLPQRRKIEHKDRKKIKKAKLDN
ncbi:mediator of RNA polymerase II transcription subunit 19-like isoform X1 [Gordionus sp. m RMFG-2023]|uniref:mediator of RNA polymerase II transcription subunit 19-like isoform X1 n=1 Tax=Gordionus sp. m RMFG-2023 TaxID=3053472 RepID=UPI0031FBE17B